MADGSFILGQRTPFHGDVRLRRISHKGKVHRPKSKGSMGPYFHMVRSGNRRRPDQGSIPRAYGLDGRQRRASEDRSPLSEEGNMLPRRQARSSLAPHMLRDEELVLSR